MVRKRELSKIDYASSNVRERQIGRFPDRLLTRYAVLAVKVLVIEAGPFDHGEDSVLVPGAYNPFPYLWPNLFTVPQTGLNNQVEFAVCGKVVGGGSTVNAMVFLRGSVGDYASWAALGNPDWTWDSFLPYFKKVGIFDLPQHNERVTRDHNDEV